MLNRTALADRTIPAVPPGFERHTGVIGVSLLTSGGDDVSGPEHLERFVSAGERQAVFVGDGEKAGALLGQIGRRLEHADLLHLTELELLERKSIT